MNNMKKILSYILLAVFVLSCQENSVDNVCAVENESAVIADGAVEGELLIKFAAAMERILDTHFATRAVATRSGIPIVSVLRENGLKNVKVSNIVAGEEI